MYYRVEVYPLPQCDDPRGLSLINKAQSVLGYDLKDVRTSDVFSVFADVNAAEANNFAGSVANQVIQGFEIGELKARAFDWVIVVGFLPGVTDNVGRSAKTALQDVIGRSLTHEDTIYSSIEYFISQSDLTKAQAETIASELLFNKLIQTAVVLPFSEWKENGTPVNEAKITAVVTPTTDTIDLEISDEDLIEMSRSKILALNLNYMQTIQAYYQKP